MTYFPSRPTSTTSSTISDFVPAVRANRLDQMAVPGANVQMAGFTLAGIAAPSSAGQPSEFAWTLGQIQTSVANLAPLASPILTGIPQAPTAALGTSTAQIATMAALAAAINALVAGAPGALDTLGEIAAQLASDESAAGVLTTTVASKLAKSANLSDLASEPTARTNLGLGTVATHAVAEFALSGQSVNIPVTSTYTSSGAIAITDSWAIVNAPSAAAMTLAAGAVDGHEIVVKRWGPGTVSVAGTIDNVVQTLAMTSATVQESLTLRWSASLASYALV